MNFYCKISFSTFFLCLSFAFSASAADLRLIAVNAVHQTDNEHVRKEEEKDRWRAQTLVFDQRSGETFRCEVTKYRIALNPQTNRPICKRIIPALASGRNFDAAMITAVIPPSLETAISPLTQWLPAPMWILETSTLQSLKFCDFSDGNLICTTGVDLPN